MLLCLIFIQQLIDCQIIRYYKKYVNIPNKLILSFLLITFIYKISFTYYVVHNILSLKMEIRFFGREEYRINKGFLILRSESFYFTATKLTQNPKKRFNSSRILRSGMFLPFSYFRSKIFPFSGQRI